MSSGKAVVRVCVGLIAAAVVICGLCQPHARGASAAVRSHATAPGAGARTTPAFELGVVPRGLRLAHAEAEAARRFFALIAADLDADGDVDVIASNGALDLLVWINDGTGRLTSHRTAPPIGAHLGSRSSSLDGRRHVEAPVWLLESDDAPIAHATEPLTDRDDIVAPLAASRVARLTSAFIRPSSSRGPPPHQQSCLS